MTDEPRSPTGPRAEPFGAPVSGPGRPLPLRQMGIGELIDGAIRLYRSEWLVLMGIVAFVTIPVTFAQLWLEQLVIGGFDVVTMTPTQAFGELLPLTVTFVVVQLFIVQPFLVAAIARAAADVYLGEPVGIGRTYRYALAKLPSILWITVISLVATLLGLVLLIIPGIIVGVRLSFAPAALVVEGLGGTKAIARSWRLSQGYFWRTLGTIVLAGIIAAVVGAIIGIPGGFAQATMPGAWPITALVTALATVLTTPFSMLVIVLLYFDLRIRKEGFDIEVMARELATAP